MHIIYLCNSDFSSSSANSVQVTRMCNALAANNCSVTLIGRNVPKIPLHKNVSLWNIKKQGIIGNWLYPFRSAIKLTKHKNTDLVYGRHVPSLIVAHLSRLPIVYEAHALAHSFTTRIVESLFINVVRPDRIVSITHTLKKDLSDRYPKYRREHIIVAPDGANIINSRIQSHHKRLTSKNNLQIGYVGHLYPGKGMEIIAPLAGKLPEHDFHVVGGRQGDLEYWKGTVHTKNLYFHGHVDPEELPKYYETLDVCLLPIQNGVRDQNGVDISRWTSPMKLFEYMAYGKAIVASNIPVLNEILLSEANALLVKSDDLNEWIKAIEQLHNRPDQRLALGIQAKNDLETKYTWNIRAKNILSHLDQLTSPTGH